MAKQNSKAHAEHVEKACEYLYASGIFPDWVITTSFYAALHYLQYRIFPAKILLAKGISPLILEDFEDYHWHFNRHGKRMGRHERFRCFVEEKCPVEISDAYSDLLESSYSSRYEDYRCGSETVEEVRTKLFLIKHYATGLPAIHPSA